MKVAVTKKTKIEPSPDDALVDLMELLQSIDENQVLAEENAKFMVDNTSRKIRY